MYERAHVDQVTALSVLYLQPSLRRDAISPPAQAVLPSRMTNAHECGRTAHAAPFCAHSAAVSLVTVGVTVVGASNVFCLWYGVGKGGGGSAAARARGEGWTGGGATNLGRQVVRVHLVDLDRLDFYSVHVEGQSASRRQGRTSASAATHQSRTA